MENNCFSKEQLNKLFSDRGFVEFFSNYFSTFANDEVLSKMDIVEGDLDELWRLYIRLFLSNIEQAISPVSQIVKNMSFSYEEKKMNVSGGIKGRLLINQYVQNKPLVRTPREYPCVVKTKGMSTPENVFFTHIVINVLEKLRRLMNLYVAYIENTNSTEYKKMNYYLSYFSSVLGKQPAASIVVRNSLKRLIDDLSSSQKTELQYRFVKNKIRNSYEYRRLFDWYDKYRNGSIQWLLDDRLNLLIYDDCFGNKLFEIWNLYRISETLRKSFGLELIGENPLSVQMDSWVYKLKSKDDSIYKVYYQKGSGLYWNDQYSQHWYYVDSDGKKKALRGIPDITVTVEKKDDRRIVLIDIKNRVRCSGENSEEIYKIIGYYSNFDDFLNSSYSDIKSRKGILVFRNDYSSFTEKLTSMSDEQIMTFSTSPELSSQLNDEQFRKICKEIV